jgi:hypothetical protein
MELTKKRRKAVLIDAKRREIGYVGINVENELEDMYQKIGCNTVDAVRDYLNGYDECKDDIWIDDDGAWRLETDDLKNSVQYGYLVPQDIRGTAFMLLWNGIVMGFDPNTGDSTDTTVDEQLLERLKHTIIFVKLVNGRIQQAWLDGEDATRLVCQR